MFVDVIEQTAQAKNLLISSWVQDDYRNEGLVLLLKSLHWIKWLRGVPLIKANWFEAHVMWAILCPACTHMHDICYFYSWNRRLAMEPVTPCSMLNSDGPTAIFRPYSSIIGNKDYTLHQHWLGVGRCDAQKEENIKEGCKDQVWPERSWQWKMSRRPHAGIKRG